MRKDILVFHKCIQNVQEIGNGDECMKSILHFTMKLGDKSYNDLQCTIKQTAGSNFEKDKSIEVFTPQIDTNYNYMNFRNAATDYYFGLLGPFGKVIHIKDATVNMTNNTFEIEATYDISD